MLILCFLLLSPNRVFKKTPFKGRQGLIWAFILSIINKTFPKKVLGKGPVKEKAGEVVWDSAASDDLLFPRCRGGRAAAGWCQDDDLDSFE